MRKADEHRLIHLIKAQKSNLLSHLREKKSESPLAYLLTEQFSPELLYLQTKWASLMSYGLTTELLPSQSVILLYDIKYKPSLNEPKMSLDPSNSILKWRSMKLTTNLIKSHSPPTFAWTPYETITSIARQLSI